MFNSPDELWKQSCLCLSGGGFRATLFHLGVILRFNELGALSRLNTITSVSGGSILNGLLACNWSQLTRDEKGVFTNLEEVVAEPMRQFCAKDLRTPIMLGTRLNPLNWRKVIRDHLSVSSNFLAEGYEPLYYGARLSELPAPCLSAPSAHAPRFVFCATNEGSGACWEFHSGPEALMGESSLGYCGVGHTRVSDAVAASSAFPPGFSAFRLEIPRRTPFYPHPAGGEPQFPLRRTQGQDDQLPTTILLTDGGVYDNLAVEPVWDSLPVMFVSDAGLPFEAAVRVDQFFLSRLKRTANIGLGQVTDIRKRWLKENFLNDKRFGAIFALDSDLEKIWGNGKVPMSERHGYGRDARKSIERVRTDLDAFNDAEIACLENHGYAMANAALLAHFHDDCPNMNSRFRWPHLQWCRDGKVVQALAHSHSRKIAGDVCRYLIGRVLRK